MMGKVIMSGIVPKLVAPSTGTPLRQFAEGSIINIPENGVAVPFYVAKHDYESGLNGIGRTLLVRRDGYETGYWDDFGGTSNQYVNCRIDTLFNGTFKGRFSAAVQAAMGTTMFYYTPGGSNYSVSTLARSVFQLSLTELGLSSANANAEGSALPIASKLRQFGTTSNVKTSQWTRTPSKRTDSNKDKYVFRVFPDGSALENYVLDTFTSRPCFTLPSDRTLIQDDGTLLFK